ncbi:IS30 family transposase [Streptococcus oralis]|uniref:IS30 family transposase n=1 Tax=Streptococcus oralis TaxID=1303 RepID=UPI0022845E1C|nr:IS30 family transposase [Streptococcus oralis]MCY7064793.1 IS30 family transposase [Streptococcus oralis]
MSTNYSTTNQSYKHLSEAERGEIEAYLSVGLKPAEIARRLGRNRSTITREINRGSITQVKKVNGQKVYYQHYYADAAHNRYRHAREASYYLKLDRVSDGFLTKFTEAMREKPRVHSVDTFVHTYRLQHVDAVVPSTKTLYNYIHQGLLEIKVIEFPRAVRIRKKFTKRPSTKKHLGKSIEERPEEINNRSRFGDWGIDSVLGGKTIGEPSILTLVERQTRYAVTKKLVEKKEEYVNQAILECMKLYPIKSITADNGNEFSSLSKIEGLDVYFAHAYSSYERGTNENFNGLLREFIPKGCSLKELNQNLLEDYTKAINERPRRIHDYQSAKKLFELTQTA